MTQNWLFWKEGHEDHKTIVPIPHDAMILEERSPECVNGTATGFLPGGIYYYETTIFGENEWKDCRLLLEFEGVYMNSTVYMNGEEIGTRYYGYSNFFIDISERILLNQNNVLKVVADNSKCPNSRWYSGSGIYRPVNLYIGPNHSIEPGSVKITTLSIDPAVIRIESPKPVRVNIGTVSGEGLDFTLTIPDATLWSAETPYLYTAHITHGDDSEDIRFGIRTLAWDAHHGFSVNGKTVKLRGGCVHHDHGILGAAAWDKAEY